MLLCKCTNKFRDKSGKILGYRLVDIDGTIIDIPSDELKDLMVRKQIEVSNLFCTMDNRIREMQNMQFREDPQLSKYIVNTVGFKSEQNIGEVQTITMMDHNTLTENEFKDELYAMVKKTEKLVKGYLSGFKREYSPTRHGDEYVARIAGYETVSVTNPKYRNDILIKVMYYPQLKQVSVETQRVNTVDGVKSPIRKAQLELTDPFTTRNNLKIIENTINSIVNTILPK